MEKEYEVPVWFRIRAENAEIAWAKISQLMGELERLDQLPDYVVEEPAPVGVPIV